MTNHSHSLSLTVPAHLLAVASFDPQSLGKVADQRRFLPENQRDSFTETPSGKISTLS